MIDKYAPQKNCHAGATDGGIMLRSIYSYVPSMAARSTLTIRVGDRAPSPIHIGGLPWVCQRAPVRPAQTPKFGHRHQHAASVPARAEGVPGSAISSSPHLRSPGPPVKQAPSGFLLASDRLPRMVRLLSHRTLHHAACCHGRYLSRTIDARPQPLECACK